MWQVNSAQWLLIAAIHPEFCPFSGSQAFVTSPEYLLFLQNICCFSSVSTSATSVFVSGEVKHNIITPIIGFNLRDCNPCSMCIRARPCHLHCCTLVSLTGLGGRILLSEGCTGISLKSTNAPRLYRSLLKRKGFSGSKTQSPNLHKTSP